MLVETRDAIIRVYIWIYYTLYNGSNYVVHIYIYMSPRERVKV